MKVAIYARVSTEDQTEQNQLLILEKWASDLNYEVIDRYIDNGVSGWKADQSDQKELRRLFVDSARGKIQMVLIYDLSRLTRRGPLEMMLTMKRFADNKVQVHSYLDTWLNVPSEWQDILVPFFGKFAELYSKQLSERTKAGMNRAKAAGKHVGRPPKFEELYTKQCQEKLFDSRRESFLCSTGKFFRCYACTHAKPIDEKIHSRGRDYCAGCYNIIKAEPRTKDRGDD